MKSKEEEEEEKERKKEEMKSLKTAGKRKKREIEAKDGLVDGRPLASGVFRG
jgi:hypothetical protein